MRQSFHLGLEAHDFLGICAFQGLDKITYLGHLYPQSGTQHDHIIHTLAHDARVCCDYGIAARGVKLSKYTCQIPCGIVDLHILPVADP